MRALFAAEELAQIPEEELNFLDKISSKEKIIYQAATLHRDNIPNLFDLYAMKFGFSEEMLNSRYGEGYTLLYIAASLNALKAIDVILSTEVGRDLIPVRNEHSRHTPLSPVIACRFNEALIKLLSTPQGKKALYLPNSVGSYPMHEAAFMGNIAAFDIVIRQFNEIDTLHLRDSNGFLPIHEATVWHKTKFISEILKYDEGLLTLSIADESGDLVIHKAANGCWEKLLVLIDTPQKRLFLNKQNKDGDTPLHIAASKWYEYVAEILQYHEGRACLKIKNNYGYNPLEIAILKEDVKTIKEIIKYKEGRDLIPYLSSKDLIKYYVNKPEIRALIESVKLADKLLGNVTHYELTDSEIEVASGFKVSSYMVQVKTAIKSHLVKFGIESQYQGLTNLGCELSNTKVLFKLDEEVSEVIEGIYNNFAPMIKLIRDSQGSISV